MAIWFGGQGGVEDPDETFRAQKTLKFISPSGDQVSTSRGDDETDPGFRGIPFRLLFASIWPTLSEMAIDAIIPFKPKNPKTRLSCVMEQAEREAFARAMLSDVLGAVRAAGCAPTLISTSPFEHPAARVVEDPAGLDDSLNRVLAQAQGPVLIIMADLPLATPEAVRRMIGTDAQMAIAPGLGGGTNAIFVKEPSRYHVNYYGASFCKHMAIAAEAGLACEVTDSFRLHTDVDEKEDLVEVLIHGRESAACRCLESLGFALSIEHGRVGVERRAHKETL
jgi:2-phospho-L-lactate guanylyltransferase